MTVSVSLQADLATIPDVVGITARTVVTLPPSDLDPHADKMRVYVGGSLIERDYDPALEA